MKPAPLAILTPFTDDPARRTGNRLWEKRVLPVGPVNYRGRKLNFTKEYNDELVRAFSDGAYDQVPFQLADAMNTHTNAPERRRGDIIAMDSRDDGLWIRMQPTEEGDAELQKNPKLGVSVRIVENYDRSDGKFYPRAVQHVLGTLDPRIPGLGAWQAIEASNTPSEIIDLTGEHFTGQGNGGIMPDLTDKQRRNLQTLLDIPEAEFDELIKGLALPQQDDAETGDTDELAELIDGLSDEDLAALEAEFDQETAAAAAATGLSNEAALAIEMANNRADQALGEVAAMRQNLDRGSFAAERNRLVRDLGIPPHWIDLAKPLLEGTGHVVELANGHKVDAGQIMRRVFEAIGQTNALGGVDIELGTEMDEPDEAARNQRIEARGDIVNRFKQQTGL